MSWSSTHSLGKSTKSKLSMLWWLLSFSKDYFFYNFKSLFEAFTFSSILYATFSDSWSIDAIAGLYLLHIAETILTKCPMWGMMVFGMTLSSIFHYFVRPFTLSTTHLTLVTSRDKFLFFLFSVLFLLSELYIPLLLKIQLSCEIPCRLREHHFLETIL